MAMTEGLPEWFTKHPLTERILEEKRSSVRAVRREAIAELEKIKSEEQTAIPKLQKSVEKAKSEYEAVEAEKKQVLGKLWTVEAELRDACDQLGRRRQEAEFMLRKNVAPEIADAIKFFNELMTSLRNSEIQFQETKGTKNLVKRTQTIYRWSNHRAISEALTYCREAIRELETMILQVEPDHARIEELKAGIPDHKKETAIEFVDQKPEKMWN